MPDALSRRLDFALAVSAEAGALALRMRPGPGAGDGRLKSPRDWVTEADAAVESFLGKALLEQFPEDGFRGEEAGAVRAGSLTWIVDPIDGTSNFARGGSRWCVSVGLLEGRRPLLGVLVAPALGEAFVGRAGRGATLNDAPMRAAATTDLDRAVVECGWSPRAVDAEYVSLVGRVIGAGAMMRAGGSGALGLADVACGRLDGYVELHINLWDVAAVLVLLAEAGVVERGFMDGPGPERGAAILAAAPGVFDALARTADFIGLS